MRDGGARAAAVAELGKLWPALYSAGVVVVDYVERDQPRGSAAPPVSEGAATSSGNGTASPPTEGTATPAMSEPAPAPLEKSHGQFRFHLMLRTKAIMRLSRHVRGVLEKLTFPEDVMVSVDVDAYHLL